ncbi:hypothetical protein ZIOFF_073159 [Zingiber officinale]|uniref:Serine-threonine/tyrosine-protein kinase catalytic domain-containing protein n=1 Tax=Zingiber officinale TaxID=94328 RepID=A0A8J5BWR0_ZINOF|nr:hypothetical protein ZIOFF_073159 [Zingiber officinale]
MAKPYGVLVAEPLMVARGNSPDSHYPVSAEDSSVGGLTHGGRGDRVAFHPPNAAMAADLERGQYVVVVLFLCCSMILGLQSITAERPLGSSTAQAGSNRSDRMEDDKPPLLGRLVNSLPKNDSHSHAWPELEIGWRVVFLVTTYKSGSIITSTLKKHKMSCFGCCEENDNNRTAASGGPYVASHSAGNYGAYLSANTPSKGAQTVKPQPIAVPAIPVDEIREITKNFGDEALIWEGSFGRVYFGVLKNERSTTVSMVSRLKHENVVELVGYSVEGNLRLLAYEFATMGSLHDILHEAVRKETTIEKPTPVSTPPKDVERQLSKKELKKKEMAELDALLHEMGIANKDSNTAQNEKADASAVDVKERIKKVASMRKKKSSKEMDAEQLNKRASYLSSRRTPLATVVVNRQRSSMALGHRVKGAAAEGIATRAQWRKSEGSRWLAARAQGILAGDESSGG